MNLAEEVIRWEGATNQSRNELMGSLLNLREFHLAAVRTTKANWRRKNLNARIKAIDVEIAEVRNRIDATRERLRYSEYTIYES